MKIKQSRYFLKWCAALAGVLTTGCSAGQSIVSPEYRQYSIGPRLNETAVKLINSHVAARATEATTVGGIVRLESGALSDVILFAEMAKLDPKTRGSIARALISNPDLMCDRYMSSVLGTTKTVTSALDMGSLALTSVATIDPSRTLTGISTILAGSEKTLQDTVLGGREAPILYEAVLAQQKSERSRLQTLLLDSKNADLVLTQIAAYHSNCGITNAQNALRETVAEASEGAEDKGIAAAASEQKAMNAFR